MRHVNARSITSPSVRYSGALALLVVISCKGGQHDTAAQGSSEKPPVPLSVSAACRAAAANVPNLKPLERAQALLDACHPCGDWLPLLTANKPQVQGGPSRATIEEAMVGCNAFCDATAKQRFLDAIEGARGQEDTRKPWRLLGEVCAAAVSAVPDTRFMSPAYFALDRIARAIADPAVLGNIEIALPPLAAGGAGVDLPTADPASPEAGPASLTIDAQRTFIGVLPVATLSATGVKPGAQYPGAEVPPNLIGAALSTLAARVISGAPVALLAPRSLPAARIASAIATARGHAFRLAVALPGPGNWTLPGTIGVSLVGIVNLPDVARSRTAVTLGASAEPAIAAADEVLKPGEKRGPMVITIEATAVTSTLATLLAAVAAKGVSLAVLIDGTAAPSAAPPTGAPAAPPPRVAPAAKPPAAKP
jgi:hypothetical protein